MFSRVIYRDDELTLAVRWFGLGRVYAESRGYAMSAHPAQARFLTRVTMRLRQHGHEVRPPDCVARLFYRSYADVLMKGQSHSYPWINWFERGSERVANDFIAQSRTMSARAEP